MPDLGHARTTYGRRLAAYLDAVAEARQRLDDLDPGADEARRQVLAELDDLYVSGAELRDADPEIRRLRQAERRGWSS